MTNELRTLVKGRLDQLKTNGFKEVFYRRAATDAMYSHIIFDLESESLTSGDLARRDLMLVIDLYTFNETYATIEAAGDTVESLFHMANLPNNVNLPTFFLESRNGIYDDDKRVNHIQLRFTVQNYMR